MPDPIEIKEKEKRIRAFLENNGYDAAVIGRQDNFAWFTCGGNNRVVITSEAGFCLLVIAKEKIYIIAHVMDGQRIMDEELQGVDVEPIFLKWYEENREEKAAQLVRGLKAVSDVSINGAKHFPSEIYKLHYPLTEKEVEKCRLIGNKTEEIISKVAKEIEQGMTEHEVEAMFLYEYGKENMTPDVLLIGSDERISKYRHPNPSDKKIERFVLLHPAVRKWGLHANVTRTVLFGDKVPDDIQKKYDAACRIEALAVSMCVPGAKFSKILEAQKNLYKETGFAEEWRNHFQGGITGYLLADPTLCNDPGAEVSVNQAFDWFITITGVKVEELSISTSKGGDILSITGKWPTKTYESNGQSFELPEILLR